ncbi:P-loop containing nucleoside triphosphate hydrolase protein [Gongronella butleri]|nr:P-loop containing nucleoside triphosphate hydrolase protein [Gongronella butleri]
MSDLVWLASTLTVLSGGSALVLSMQRSYHQRIQLSEHQVGADRRGAALAFDHERDKTVPFSDASRLPRLTFGTTIAVLFGIYKLVSQATRVAQDQQEQARLVLACALYLVSWLYALALVLVSRRYPLPSEWGFVLNGHLACFYITAWVILVRQGWLAYCSATAASTPWPLVAPWIIEWLLVTDMVYSTWTIPSGPPFLDDDKHKRVLGNNSTSLWGFLTFSYMNDLVQLAYRQKRLDEQDLPILPASSRGRYLFDAFSVHRSSSLLYRLILTNRKHILYQFIYVTLASMVYYAPAFFMNRILSLIEEIGKGLPADVAFQQGVVLIVGLGIGTIAIAFAIGQLWYYSEALMHVHVKAMVNLEIYRKTLRRFVASSASKGDDDGDEDDDEDDDDDATPVDYSCASTGTIVNLMSTDSSRISELSHQWFAVWAAICELIVGIALLYQLLGNACFFGFLVMIVSLPLTHFNTKVFTKYQDKMMEARDKRVNLMNEILHGIRHIKFFAWERNWEERIAKARKEELRHVAWTLICDAIFILIWFIQPVLVVAISFYTYSVVEGNVLTAPVAFTSITILSELRFSLTGIPDAVIDWLRAMVSVRRLSKYLDERELDEREPIHMGMPVRIGFDKATIGFVPVAADDKDESMGFVLKDLNIEFPKGELSLICGATGSGKSLLLLSLLGETTVLEGDVHFPRAPIVDSLMDDPFADVYIPQENWILDHSVAYVAQSAWLQNASIKDNILFGLPYVEKRYHDTIYACSLIKDLNALDSSDETEIGEKGITLSGGQKARVALARAVYSRAGIVVMDDVLSAVDAHTARHIYEHCLTGPLMRGRTRLLVTHHVSLCLSEATYLVHIEDGRTNMVGSPDSLRKSGQLATILDEEKEQDEEEAEEEAIETSSTDDVPVDVLLKKEASSRVLVEEEHRAVGQIKMRYYGMYFKRVGGPFLWIMFFIALFTFRGMDVVQSWWISVWTRANEQNGGAPAVDGPNGDKDGDVIYYLSVYLVIMSVGVVASSLRFAIVYYGGLQASNVIYAELLHRVLHAPMRFFDRTPVGRILNRFSNDIETIDTEIPAAFVHFLGQLLDVGSIILVATWVIPLFALPMIGVAVMAVAIGIAFVYTARELRRMESVSKSPVLSHFSETVLGVSTIRAFGATRRFFKEMVERTDNNARPVAQLYMIDRWISMKFGFVGTAISMISAAIVLLNLHHVDASQAGFFLSFIFLFTDECFYTIQRYTAMEISFNAVERVAEYVSIEQEPDNSSVIPPPEWPTHGAIEIEDLKVRYDSDLDLVLKGVSANIKGGESIGIVGKTGCGKSTLTLALFRFLQFDEGSKISIDGIDISKVPLHDLRSRINIVPQDPNLFSGNLRSNMDPFNEFTDDQIFEAFERVHLIRTPTTSAAASTSNSRAASIDQPVNQNVFENLDSPVTESGKNLSQGQRQLLCLARALLKRSKVVVMDEATSSVDFETDKAIQNTIQSALSESTVLCVAHRLHSVITYDRILVIDAGKVVEFASPWDLINDAQSVFHAMCRKSGEFDSLHHAAKAKHDAQV